MVSAMSAAATHAADPPADANAAARTYRTAAGLLDRGLYELSIPEFQRFLTTYADHEKAPLAQYGLAVAQYRLGHCAEALSAGSPLRDRTDFEYLPEVLVIIGQCRLEARDYPAAAEAFAQVVAQFPEHVIASAAAAGAVEASYGAARYDDTLSLANRFLERFPDHPLRDRVEFLAASSQMARKDFTRAAGAFARLAARSRDDALVDRATFHAAQCYEQAGDLPRAIKQYGRALERKDSAIIPDALLALAQIAERQERLDEAGKLADLFLERFPHGDRVAPIRLLRGRIWLAQGKLDQAGRVFDGLVDDPSLAPEIRCEAAYHAAKVRLRQDAPGDAATKLARLIEQFPGCSWEPDARYDLGVSRWKADRLDDAFEAFGALRASFPDHELAADALHAQAGIEQQRKRHDESARLAREFQQRYPTHRLTPSAAFLIAEGDSLGGRTGEAVDEFREFLSQYPDDARAADARARLGALLYRLGKLEDAEPFLRDAAARSVTDRSGAAAPKEPRAADANGSPASPTTLLALGDVYFQRGEWKQAEETLSKYVASADAPPAAEDALLRIGLAQTRQGRHDDAARTLDQLLVRFPAGVHRAQTLFELGQVHLLRSDRANAEKCLRAVLDDPSHATLHAPALRHLAAIAMQDRDYADAAARFRRLAELAESAVERRNAAYQQGVALMAAKDFAAARAAFAPLTQSDDDLPLRAASLAQVGSACVRENRCADAVTAFDEIPGGWATVVDPSLRAAAQYDHAWCLRELGRTDDAERAFRRLADADDAQEHAAFALLDLANLEASAQHWDAAVETLRRLLSAQTKPGDVPEDSAMRELFEHARYRLGIAEFQRGRLAEASKALEDFLIRFPGSPLIPSAEFYAGESAFRAQRWEVAARHFARLVEGYPSDAAAEVAGLRLGDALASLQRWGESERAYSEHLVRFGDREQWFAAQFGVGWALENQQKYDEAIDAYGKVVARHDGPTAARAQFQIGECRFAQRRFDDALRELLKVDILYASPEWKAAALFEAGRCLEEAKKPDDARGQFRRVVENHAGTKWAELAAKRLGGATTASPSPTGASSSPTGSASPMGSSSPTGR